MSLAIGSGGALPTAAQDAAPQAVTVEPWQAVITSQIEAFRTRNATAAFAYAAGAFHTAFPSAEAFFSAIIGSGYAPIMESRSHSFGPYQQVNENVVLQAVRFIGPDSVLYDAIYQLNREPDGWRVGGVQLVKTTGMGA